MSNLKISKWMIACLITINYLAGLSNLCAQDKIHYSFDMGVTVSFFDKSTAPYYDPAAVEEFDKASRASLELGGNANYSLSDAFSLSAGLRYTEKGGGYKTKNPNFIYVNSVSGNKTSDAYNYLKYRLVYLEIPVLVKLNLYEVFNIQSDKSDLKLYGGVSGMFNIGSKLRYNVFSSSAKESWKAVKLDGAERLVASYVTGLEFRENGLLLYARYTKNISNVYNTSKAGYEHFDVQMNTISLGLGFILN